MATNSTRISSSHQIYTFVPTLPTKSTHLAKLPLLFALIKAIAPDQILLLEQDSSDTSECLQEFCDTLAEKQVTVRSLGGRHFEVGTNNLIEAEQGQTLLIDLMGVIKGSQFVAQSLCIFHNNNSNKTTSFPDPTFRFELKDHNVWLYHDKKVEIDPIAQQGNLLSALGERLELLNQQHDAQAADLAELKQIVATQGKQLRVVQSIAEDQSVPERVHHLEDRLEQVRMVANQILANQQKDQKAKTSPAPTRLADPCISELSEEKWAEIALIRAAKVFDDTFYATNNPSILATGMDLIEHYVKHGCYEDRNPHLLFSNTYYAQHAEYMGSSMSPLGHLLSRKGPTSLSPHPLFDVNHYQRQVDAALDEPYWAHYIRTGWIAGLSPNPFFEPSYYAKGVPEVRSSGMNTLSHYLTIGSRLGIKPSKGFDPQTYRLLYPDVEEAGFEPLSHFVQFGKAEGRVPKEKAIEDYHAYLPTLTTVPARRPPTINIEIVIPVYSDYHCTRKCLESVIKGRKELNYSIVVINDCSPEPAITTLLRDYATASEIILIENEHNQGFVASVNRGMSNNEEADVILLNSDTVVPAGWADTLTQQAYSQDSIGTVCPLSNNATACNFPTLAGFNEYPAKHTVDSINQACQAVNQGRNVPLPTAVGSCMYIKRACLKEVGTFNEETWGTGYGEENDFSMRALRLGWQHMLAVDCFIHHEGEKSFKASAAQKKAAATIKINELYPEYEELCRAFFRNDPAKGFRVAASVRCLRQSTDSLILYIEHGLGGGAEKALQEEIRSAGRPALILRRCRVYNDEFDLELFSVNTEFEFRLVLRSLNDQKFLVDFLKSCQLDKISVQHTMGLPLDLSELIRQLQVPFDLSVHDYYFICPRVTLLNTQGQYCGEPDLAGCTQCLGQTPYTEATDIIWWRQQNNWFFDHASTITAPSQDCAQRLQKYFPNHSITTKPHEQNLYQLPLTAAILPKDKASTELRVALLGVMTLHKGSSIVQDVLELAKDNSLKFKLIGYVEAGIDCQIEQTGRYREEDLAELIKEFDPHLIWLPSVCPETYSFTLSTAMQSRRPILATDFGAFPERLANRLWSWTYPASSPGHEILQIFKKISLCIDEGEYRAVSPTQQKPNKALNTPYNLNLGAKPKIIVIPELFGGRPSPCAYIRALLPLSHPTVLQDFTVEICTANDLTTRKCDIVFTQRLALNAEATNRTLEYLATNSQVRLVYDLDDNLLDIPADHPDHSTYSSGSLLVQQLLAEASVTWVSTNYLAHSIYARQAIDLEVIPNALDERIWLNADTQTCPGHWKTKPVNVLYMGTQTHTDDFRMIRPALREIAQKWGTRVNFEIIGAIEPGEPETWFRMITPPGIQTQTYPAFVNWLRRSNRYSIGIAPLVDTTFTRSKSSIKLLDYSALGLASIVSDVESYRQNITNNEDGLLVPNYTEAWFTALDSLIKDPMNRGMLRWGAYSKLRAQHTLKQVNQSRAMSLLRLAGIAKHLDVAC